VDPALVHQDHGDLAFQGLSVVARQLRELPLALNAFSPSGVGV
jgi:hypothetical protein